MFGRHKDRGGVQKKDKQPKSYKKIEQYNLDGKSLQEKNRTVKVMHNILWTTPDPSKEVTLYHYRKKREHASDWELASKFKRLEKLEGNNAIMTCYDWFESNTSYIVAFESLSGGSLLDRLQNYSTDLGFDEMDAQSVMKQIFSGVEYLHERGIVHRGLWLGNFVYCRPGESTIKIADWDYAMQAKTDQELHFLSDGHMFDNKRPVCSYSPEMVRASLPGHYQKREGYGRPSDLWALGVCLYKILAFLVPVHAPGHTLQDRKMNYLEQVNRAQIPYRSDDWVRVSKEAKDLVQKLLCVDPQSRITIKDARKHKWTTASDLKPADGGGMRDLGLMVANANLK